MTYIYCFSHFPVIKGALSFIGGSLKSLGGPGPVVSTMVLSAGLYASYFPIKYASHETSQNKKEECSNDENNIVQNNNNDENKLRNRRTSQVEVKNSDDDTSTNRFNIKSSEISPFHSQKEQHNDCSDVSNNNNGVDIIGVDIRDGDSRIGDISGNNDNINISGNSGHSEIEGSTSRGKSVSDDLFSSIEDIEAKHIFSLEVK